MVMTKLNEYEKKIKDDMDAIVRNFQDDSEKSKVKFFNVRL